MRAFKQPDSRSPHRGADYLIGGSSAAQGVGLKVQVCARPGMPLHLSLYSAVYYALNLVKVCFDTAPCLRQGVSMPNISLAYRALASL